MDTPIHNDANRPMKVVLICHSDMLGGASVVTYRLMQALRRENVDARMVVYTRLSDDPNVSLISSREMRGLKFLIERGIIFLGNGMNRDNLFKVSLANTGTAIHKHPWVKEADVVCLNWINQGLMSLSGIKRLCNTGKPVIWTMHDMWALTGICHHAYECTRYHESCGNCPFLTGKSPNDLSYTTWKKKKKLYDHTNIQFVAVSHWLAEKCAESSLLRQRNVKVIPNAFPIDTFTTTPRHRVESFNIDYSRNLILMGAARLDDPIKGIEYAVDALNYLFDNYPTVASHNIAVFFGEIRNRSVLDNLRFPYRYVGRINDPKMLRQLYASAKVVLSTSLYETLPGTLIEGQAAGCVPVAFGRGGQTDIIDHKINGYIAEYKNPVSVAEGILWALDSGIEREELHEEVGRRFSASVIARQYIDLFNHMLQEKNS